MRLGRWNGRLRGGGALRRAGLSWGLRPGSWVFVSVAVLVLGSGALASEADRGAEHDKAVSALGAARNALRQVDGGTVSAEARAKLDEAQKLFDAQKYAEAADAADAAWRLVSSSAAPGTTFSVEVKPDGRTRVTSQKGQPVRVEAQGVQRSVSPGRTVLVDRGEAPGVPAVVPPPLAPPKARSPRQHAKLHLRADKAGNVGPLKLTWRASAGATGYEIVLLPEKEGAAQIVLSSVKPEVIVQALPPGRYAWQVKAKADGDRVSEPSEARLFEVEPARIKLEVRGTDWK